MANRVPLSYDPTYGYPETILSTDNINMQSGGKIVNLVAGTTAGDSLAFGQSGASLAGLTLTAALAMGGFQINNIANAVNPQDVPSYSQVQGLINGVVWKNPVLAVSTSNITLSAPQTVDGVALVAGNRVLVAGQTTASQNGIYVVAAGAWTRSTDMAAGSSAANDAMFVEEGTANAETAWVCTSITGSDVVGTNSLTFTQFSSATGYTAGSGLLLTGHQFSAVTAAAAGTQVNGSNQIAVKITATNPGLSLLADGVQSLLNTTGGLQHTSTGDSVLLPASSGLQTTATGLSVLLPASSGLQATGTGLSVLADPNGGLTTSATGTAIKPDTTTAGNPTVAVGANGLRVIGLPSLFNINSVAVSANVTAPNLGTLTGGTTSNADALHAHMILQGSYTTVSALTLGAPVYWSSTANQVDLALGNTDAKSFVVGVATSATAASGVAPVVFHGLATGVLSGATPGAVYWLSPTGGLSSTFPGAGGNRSTIVGTAKNATDLYVQIRDYGKIF